MKDKTLLKLSLATAILGIIALFLITELIELPEKSIANALEQEGFVKISGKVTSVRSSESITYIKLSDESGQADIIYFGKTDLKKGSDAEVIGKVGSYKGSKQIEAKEIRLT